MRYFITLACYGTHLHGHESGSVDRQLYVAVERSFRAATVRKRTLPCCSTKSTHRTGGSGGDVDPPTLA